MNCDPLLHKALPLDPCPDADMLAAWSEARLKTDEADAIRVHLQACPSCAGLAVEERSIERRAEQPVKRFLILAASLLLGLGLAFYPRGSVSRVAEVPDLAPLAQEPAPRFRGNPGRASLLAPKGAVAIPRPVFVAGPFAPLRIEVFPLDAKGMPSTTGYRLEIQNPEERVPWPPGMADLKPGSYLCLIEGDGLVSTSQVFRILPTLRSEDR